jgi:predicted transcriptional regulator
MRLTPRQLTFLRYAAVEGTEIKKVFPFSRTPYWRAGNYELREKFGDALRSEKLIERSSHREPYRITDAGRAAIKDTKPISYKP